MRPEQSKTERLWRAPALQAMLLQLLALVPMLGLVYLLALAQLHPSYFTVALVQGLCACALSWWRPLAVWWRAIQLLFPLTLYLGLQLNLPPLLFLGAFVLFLLLYWSSFRTQVPYYPSGPRIWAAVFDLLPASKRLKVIDIGSGLGGFVLQLARLRPDCQIEGIELAPLPWLASRLRAWGQGSRAHFLRGDYEDLDFADYDAVFAYLSPAAMSALWRKASAEMRPGSMLLSVEFGIAEKTADLCLRPPGRGPCVYVWHF